MIVNFKSLLKRLFLLVGLDVSFYRDGSHILERLNVDCVLDIGANTGQFAEGLRKSGFMETIISFEPLSQAHKVLCQRSKSDPKWVIAERVAIGAYDEMTEINVANNLQSSSLLPMLPLHAQAALDSIYTHREKVFVKRLESFVQQYSLNKKRLFIKIDTQGFEKSVLEGLGMLWDNVVAFELEISTEPLYENSANWLELFQIMHNKGFKIWDIKSAFRSPQEGRLLQFDCLFVRH